MINPFVDTDYPQPPLGLAMIAAVLEKKGYAVKILDLPALKLSKNSVSSFISVENPDLVGISAMTPNLTSAINLARQIKEVKPEVVIVLGGPHATLFPGETLQNVPEVDIVVQGEGEETIVELVKTFERGESVNPQILGIAYRKKKGIQINPKRPFISNIDYLPFPSFNLLPMNKYILHPPHGKRTPAIPIMTSRGCPYRCIYCSKSVFGRKYRANSPEYIVNEIEYLIEKFNAKEITFYDDVFTLDAKRIHKICDGLDAKGIDIPWTCETRVNLVTRELVERMKKSGCYLIAYGVESGNQTILNNLKKDIMIKQITQAFKMTHETGIQTVAYFMIGSPGETHETIKETIALAKKINPDFAQFSVSTPFPGTELFDIASKSGLVSKNWNDYVYAELRAIDFPAFETSDLTKEALQKWNITAYKSFYIRPQYILKRIKKIRSFDEMKLNIKGLLMFTELLRKKH
ncbi:MAG: B12-binding domain-containing radical SAM protein [Candidatus Bathyarchaeota archaeon]|nr:B12-binding domain-containing radical SAM protein [Candidatus Bathyarchaeum sp.]